jgi:hypothetical protein
VVEDAVAVEGVVGRAVGVVADEGERVSGGGRRRGDEDVAFAAQGELDALVIAAERERQPAVTGERRVGRAVGVEPDERDVAVAARAGRGAAEREDLAVGLDQDVAERVELVAEDVERDRAAVAERTVGRPSTL